MADKKESFNDEPVYYCKHCLSLRIKTVTGSSNIDFCDECGSTDIGKTHINEWRSSYKDRYGFEF